MPQQEIADALLAAGADQEVGVGQVGGEQVTGDQILIDGIERHLPRLDLGGDSAHRGSDLGPAAIGQRDGQIDPAIVARQRLGIVDQRDDVGREPGDFADHAQPHAVAMQFSDLAAQIMAQEPH